jgi:hypothetical protein
MSCFISTLDLTPKNLKIKMALGDTLNFTITITDDDGPTDVSGVDEVEFIINDEVAGSLTTGEINIIGAGSNVIEVVINLDSEIEIGEKDYRLVLTFPDDVVKTLIDGKLVIE